MARRLSTVDRLQADVQHPTKRILKMEEAYGPDGLPRDELLLEHFKSEGRLADDVARRIIETATALLRAEPNVVDVPAPVTIVGDLHGQFFDLVKLFTVGGDPKTTRYLFLGDYVVRKHFVLGPDAGDCMFRLESFFSCCFVLILPPGSRILFN
jgi:serine/threonine-protein phosphatase 2B catalytic subunit